MWFSFKEKVTSQEAREALLKMNEQIKEEGGELHFLVKVDEEGWFAECREFPGIIAGDSNKNPSSKEIFLSIIEAVKAAFGVPESSEEMVDQQSPVRVKLEQEFLMPNYLGR